MDNQQINLMTFILTLISFYFAFFQWKKTIREKRIHLLKIIKVQLDCLGPWMGVPGHGYGDDLTEDQKFDNANPYKLIYETASEQLISLNMLDEMNNVSNEIIGELNQLYYDLIRIINIQNFRNTYITSDIKTSNSLSKKLKQYKCENSIISISDFSKSLKENEKIMLERLLHYGKVLHCDVIGNKDRSARQHWEKLYAWANNQLQPQNDLLFIFVTYFVLAGLAYSMRSMDVFNIHYWFSIILLGFVISFFNGAIDGLVYRFARFNKL